MLILRLSPFTVIAQASIALTLMASQGTRKHQEDQDVRAVRGAKPVACIGRSCCSDAGYQSGLAWVTFARLICSKCRSYTNYWSFVKELMNLIDGTSTCQVGLAILAGGCGLGQNPTLAANLARTRW